MERAEEERIRKIVHEYLRSGGLNRLYLIDFTLPSEELKSRVITDEGEIRKVLDLKALNADTRKRLRSLRVKFYDALYKIGAFRLAAKAWVIPPEREEDFIIEVTPIVREINNILAKAGIPPRSVGLVEMYVPHKYVVENINKEIELVKQSIRDVMRRMEEEREKRKIVQQLSKQLAQLERRLRELERTRSMLLRGIVSEELLGEEVGEAGSAKLKA